MKHALRSLAKTPGFTLVAVLTLALCIGANSAIFSVVHAILLKPYPWPDSEKLVYVYNTYPGMGLQNAGVSIPDYLDRREGVSGFADSAMYYSYGWNLGGGGEPERVNGVTATPSLFTTLKTGAALGRVFTEDDAKPGAPKVVVLSHSLWKNRFGADPAILGKSILLANTPLTVIGVMPETFFFPTPRAQVWVPFGIKPEQRTDAERGHEFSTMIARLKPGATIASVQRDLDLIERRNEEHIPQLSGFWKTAGFGGRTQGFLEQNVENIRGMLWLVQAGVAAALLIGCANVASLLLARAVSRERELAIRAALGATRGKLIQLLLTESLILFLLGGALGLLVAVWGVGGLEALGLSSLPRAEGIALDPTVFAFTLLCALGTGLIFGALPAWSASRADAAAGLKEAGARGTAGRRTQSLRAILVVTEIALAVMLLSTAGLLVKSFQKLQLESPGFTPGGVLTAQLTLPVPERDAAAKYIAFHDSAVSALRAIPGVTAAGITTTLPFSGDNDQGSYTSPDIVIPPGAPIPHGQVRQVDSGYLHALGLTLLRGRWIADTDTASSQPVVVIDRVLADRYWPGQDPIGKRIVRGDTAGKSPCIVVGVVAPVKNRNLEEAIKKETLYFPYAQHPEAAFVLVVKTAGDPAALAASVRHAIRQADPDQPVFDVKTMGQRMEDAAQPRRAPMVLLSLFSGVALLLAALGVYGILAFSVAQRTSEFGIRLALGATARDIATLILRQGGLLVAVGIAAGLLGYLALSRIVAQLLYGVAATDPSTLAIAPLVLALVALFACLLPARRATKVDPIVALRSE
ncbi:MAG: ABC transporter permease [Verrucomicrobia bacterium]|nr:ABC transporter permease [Verrucomicrobiota bacterium]